MIGFRDFVIIILLLGLTGRLFADAKFDEGNRLGVEAAYNILKDINTPEKINNRFSKPLTNNDSLLETFDKDPKRIDVQLTNESSDQFLEITIQPILLTGELDINIKADFNLKGRFTQVLAIPFSVSGVCAQNGFISCSPEFNNQLFWERNFYPNVNMIANDLHSKGLLESGEYIIVIDW